MFWFRGRAGEEIALGKIKKLVLAVDASVAAVASEEPEMTELEEKPATESSKKNKNRGFVQQDPSEKDLSHPASQPPAGAGFQSSSIIDGSQ